MNVANEVAARQRMTTHQLRDRSAEVFGESTAANNKTWLLRRIAWRLQALAEGDLSDRARARAAELARDADLRVVPPREKAALAPAAPAQTRTGTLPRVVTDNQLHPPGAVLTRKYKGGTVQVEVLAGGFEYDECLSSGKCPLERLNGVGELPARNRRIPPPRARSVRVSTPSGGRFPHPWNANQRTSFRRGHTADCSGAGPGQPRGTWFRRRSAAPGPGGPVSLPRSRSRCRRTRGTSRLAGNTLRGPTAFSLSPTCSPYAHLTQ
ncbi:MAG TPA: DUF2924 domain-containing protein [Gemmataceae bacterium]|nr:DUF2924 domain-containing protein [Gemmataceae bacterium]